MNKFILILILSLNLILSKWITLGERIYLAIDFSRCHNNYVCNISRGDTYYVSSEFESNLGRKTEYEYVRRLGISLKLSLNVTTKSQILKLFGSMNMKVIATNYMNFVKTCDQIEIYDTLFNPKTKYRNIAALIPNMFDYDTNFDQNLQRCFGYYNINDTYLACINYNIVTLNIQNNQTIFYSNLRVLSLKNNKITTLTYKTTNIFRFAFNLVTLDLLHNPIKLIECKTFVAAINLRFLRFGNTLNEDDLQCIFHYNRNIQEILYNFTEYLWNKCDYLDSTTRNQIYFPKPINILKDQCIDNTNCLIEINNDNLLFSQIEYNNNSLLRRVKISGNFNVLFIKNIYLNVIDFEDYSVFYNCESHEYDIFSNFNYDSYRDLYVPVGLNLNITSKEYDLKFEKCVKKSSDKKVIDCHRQGIRYIALETPYLLSAVQSLNLRQNRIKFLKKKVMTSAPKLINLDLSGNPIFVLEIQAFNRYPNLRRLLLSFAKHRKSPYINKNNQIIQQIIFYHPNKSKIIFEFNQCPIDVVVSLKDDLTVFKYGSVAISISEPVTGLQFIQNQDNNSSSTTTESTSIILKERDLVTFITPKSIIQNNENSSNYVLLITGIVVIFGLLITVLILFLKCKVCKD